MDHHHGHHHHHHPPPPFPPPPQVHHHHPPPPQAHHTGHFPGPHAPPPNIYPPPPPPPAVDHHHHPPPPQAHHTGHFPGPHAPPPNIYPPSPPPPAVDHHHHHPHIPHFPAVVHHHEDIFANRPSVKMYCKAAGTNYSLSIRSGKVILARSNPSDSFQHWIKDEKFSNIVKDEEGLPSFALINKATGQAMKHSIGATHPVQLIPYNPNILDESILWSEKDLGDGHNAIRMVNNIRLNVDAFNGDKKHGGVHDGTTIVLWEWKKGDNQRWKITPHCKSKPTFQS